MAPYPKVVAFDLDGTVWYHWLNDKKFKKWCSSDIADNLERVAGTRTVRDRLNHKTSITLAADFPSILEDLVSHKVQIAIVSRNTSKALCDRAMWYFKIRDPVTKRMKPITDYLKYDEIVDESKQEHFKRIKQWSKFQYSDMLIFDDLPINIEVETWEGVTFKLITNHKGITYNDYTEGLKEWRRNQAIRVASSVPRLLDPHPNKLLIGFVGTDRATAQLYLQGKRRPFSATSRPARWGYGLYISDNPQVAMFFSQWMRDNGNPNNLHVCEIFARDGDVFKDQLKKIWFYPEGKYMTNNTGASASDASIAKSQVRRDQHILKEFKVKKPYVLISKHHYMTQMSKPSYKLSINSKTRFNEMVVYPQIQDALMFGVDLTLPHARKLVKTGKLKKMNWDNKVKSWKILVPSATAKDSKKHGEKLRAHRV